MTYTAPLADIQFTLRHIGGLPDIAALPGLEHASDDTVDAVLEAAAARRDVLAPLNRVGDLEGARWRTAWCAPRRASPTYEEFVAGGWNGAAVRSRARRPGPALALAAAVQEMWQAANLAFALCPMLTQGAIEALRPTARRRRRRSICPSWSPATGPAP